MGILGLGFVSAYLSQPLLDGFAMGASVTILTSQLRHLLGVRVPRHQGPGLVVSTWLSLLRSAGQANLCDVLTSAVCLATFPPPYKYTHTHTPLVRMQRDPSRRGWRKRAMRSEVRVCAP